MKEWADWAKRKRTSWTKAKGTKTHWAKRKRTSWTKRTRWTD